MIGRALAIAENDARLFRRDPVPLLVMITMPLLLIAFLRPAYELMLEERLDRDLNGAEHGVPGIAVMFGALLVPNLGFGVFREHGWNTWDRLRSGTHRTGELVLGKLLAPFGVALAQQVVLFVVGGAVYGLHVEGSFIALALVVASLCLLLVSMAMAMVSVTRTVMQFNALASLLGFLMAGVGGALIPSDLLPEWADTIGRVTPIRWVMEGFERVIVFDGGLGAVVGPVAVVGAFAAGLLAIVRWRFRVDETKTAWA